VANKHSGILYIRYIHICVRDCVSFHIIPRVFPPIEFLRKVPGTQSGCAVCALDGLQIHFAEPRFVPEKIRCEHIISSTHSSVPSRASFFQFFAQTSRQSFDLTAFSHARRRKIFNGETRESASPRPNVLSIPSRKNIRPSRQSSIIPAALFSAPFSGRVSPDMPAFRSLKAAIKAGFETFQRINVDSRYIGARFDFCGCGRREPPLRCVLINRPRSHFRARARASGYCEIVIRRRTPAHCGNPSMRAAGSRIRASVRRRLVNRESQRASFDLKSRSRSAIRNALS